MPETEHSAQNDNPRPDTSEAAKPRTVVYCPLPDDFDETESAGVKFKAYEPTELPPGKAFLADKFANNPWFAADLASVDPVRKEHWEKARNASRAAHEAKAEADSVGDEARALSANAEGERKEKAHSAAAAKADETQPAEDAAN